MKVKNSILLIILSLQLGFTVTDTTNIIEPVATNVIHTHTIKIDKPKMHTVTTQYDEFINDIGFSESGNDYSKVNTLGYLGRFQFGKSTLKTLKYRGSFSEFLTTPELQDKFMLKNLKFNKRRLQKYIDKYSGTIINGITITESGILAAAHLGGVGSVRRFFKYGKNSADLYGTTIINYMTKFSGYELNLN